MSNLFNPFWTEDTVKAFNAIELPAQRHSPTSVAAADGAKQTAHIKRDLVLMHLKAAFPDGLTDEEIDAAAGVASTLRPRRVGLCREGLVKDSGRTRKTRHGREAVVWVWVGTMEEQA
jgi:hypothetical protein